MGPKPEPTIQPGFASIAWFFAKYRPPKNLQLLRMEHNQEKNLAF